MPNRSLSFDGDNYVDIENISAYNNLNDFTVSLDFKTDQSHSGASLVINEDYPTAGGFWQLTIIDGNINFYLWNNNVNPHNEIIYQNINCNDNQWHQVVVNRYGSDGKVLIYIDGILDLSW